MKALALSRPTVDKAMSPVDQAYHYVLQAVLSGELAPGMRVPAEAVAEALGISRMPVRDAFRRLEGDGVVVIFPNRGAAVAEYTPHEVTQLIEMRAVLEGLAARLAVPHVAAAEVEELRHRKLQMEKSSDNLAKWMGYHDNFHNYLTSLSGRPLLMKQTERMRLMLNPYYRRYYEQSRELEIVGLEHQKIIDTIEYKDANHLEQMVRGHALVNVEKIASFA
jgi:DNA-binding GntR family transcriptional regulator